MDLNYSEEQLPKVTQVENYVSYQRKLDSGNHDVQTFNNQLQSMTQEDATHTSMMHLCMGPASLKTEQ